MNKGKTYLLYSKDLEVNKKLEELKENTKLYSRFEEALKLLGNFRSMNFADIYSIDEENESIKAWVEDIDGNIFVFNLVSQKKDDLLKVTKITNECEKEYDITLSKKFELNENNIELTRSLKNYNFKFGRLVTDLKNFYTLFINNDIGYKIEGDFNSNISDELLKELNKLEQVPKFLDYIKLFEKILKQNNITFNSALITYFKEFEIMEKLQIGEKKEENKKIGLNNN